jgi:SAM-dependent methyltransferase
LSTSTFNIPGELSTSLPSPTAEHWSASEQAQQEHYDLIAPEYEAHYSDPASLEYRRRFIYEPMFDGLDLSGKNVLDAMCGSGQTTKYLMSRGAHVTGLDLSHKVIEQFKTQWPSCIAVERSILESGFRDNSFDCISIVGGLHHMHPHLSKTVREIHRILKPGGHFCFMEPHAGSLPNLIRRVWYKHDRLFADNEAAIDLNSMKMEFGSEFEFKSVSYRGNLAFLLVLNSLIFRIPLGLKPHYSPLLMSTEAMFSKLQGKLNSCFAVGQWQKKPAS